MYIKRMLMGYLSSIDTRNGGIIMKTKNRYSVRDYAERNQDS